jgi:putative aminopeptidase FrvX
MTGAEFSLQVLRELLERPTAPFREERVAACVIGYLQRWQIPFRLHDTGAVIAEYRNGSAAQPLVLMAHMDHPACILQEPSGPGADWIAQLEGSVHAAYFAQEVPVRVYARDDGPESEGHRARVVGYEQGASPRAIRLLLRLADAAAPHSLQPGDFAIWDVPAYQYDGDLIHGRALDDLVGCAEMLLTLEQAVREGWQTDLTAVFTRAEEVGLVGGYAVLASGALRPESIVVSLEVSPLVPGVAQGHGPIIRVGDRRTTFSYHAEILLRAAEQRLQADREQGDPFPVQRQLMSGGSCEASAAVLLGFTTTGLTLPLGNYHNQGPDGTFAPETIHAQDFLSSVALLGQAARLLPEYQEILAAARAAIAPTSVLLERLHAPFNPVGSLR